MDYMWNEMKITVRCNKVPIYGSYLQTLIDSKIPTRLAKNYLTVDSMTPATRVLTRAKKSAAVRSSSKRARPSSDIEEHSSSAHDSPNASTLRAPEPKAKFSITKAFQKMNCFFMDKQHQDYKAYKSGKASRRNKRSMMTALELSPDPATSDELDEAHWQSKNTLWLGDDMTSLGQFRPSYLEEASTSHVPPVPPTDMHVDQGADDDLAEDDDEQDGNDDEAEEDDSDYNE